MPSRSSQSSIVTNSESPRRGSRHAGPAPGVLHPSRDGDLPSTTLHYLIREPGAPSSFSSAVSLHGHTLYSKESTYFVAGIAKRFRLFNWFVRRQLHKYSQKYGEHQLTDLAEQTRRMWWTSPVSPAEALQVEKKQIVDRLGVRPMVSITDHDTIEAPLQLQMIADNDQAPISVEWTTPYQDTYFHVGVHNLHPEWAIDAMADMKKFTDDPQPGRLRELFEELSSYPDVLIVLNHPYWDQPWNGQEKHDEQLLEFLEEYDGLIHALEINGLRTWTENRKVVELARSQGCKLISGGDRHSREPNATLNLTNAMTFAEFVGEIRGDGQSEVLIMPHYHDPLAYRIIQALAEIMSNHPTDVLGRVHWSHRVFRRCESGDVKTFSEFLSAEDPDPALIRRVIDGARWLTGPRMRRAWKRMAVPEEAVL
jgi:hypothetical protein